VAFTIGDSGSPLSSGHGRSGKDGKLTGLLQCKWQYAGGAC
jgi:hypothetical protein